MAVRSLCGGAGATVLTHLLALAAVRTLRIRSEDASVLALEASGTTGGLAHYVGAESRYSLDEMADALAADRLDTGGMVARVEGGFGLVATGARPSTDGDVGAVQRILADARAAHGLTVIDCGQLATRSSRLAAGSASHVLSVLPATSQGLRRARHALHALPSEPARYEALVARADGSSHPASVQALSTLAEDRGARLILMPEVGELADTDPDGALETCEVTLQAIATFLRT